MDSTNISLLCPEPNTVYAARDRSLLIGAHLFLLLGFGCEGCGRDPATHIDTNITTL